MVGFALETNNEEINAKNKLERKNLDFIVLNSTRNEGTTFRSNDNQIEIITKNEIKTFEKKNKKYVAADIIDELTKLFTEKTGHNHNRQNEVAITYNKLVVYYSRHKCSGVAG